MLTTPIRSVTSGQNSRVKALRAALERPGRDGVIGIEGEHMLHEAVRSGLTPGTVFVVAGFEERLERLPLPAGTEVIALSEELFSSIASTESPQPVAALVKAPAFPATSIVGPASKHALILIAAGLQDPGNLGTLVRSAEAFGATGMILLPGTVSEWNAKALRASSGSVFRLPMVHCGMDEAVSMLRAGKIRILAAVAAQAGTVSVVEDLCGSVAIMIGNEGAGLSTELIGLADGRITIPCPGMTESLNAAVAGSVLLYEASRQRTVRDRVVRLGVEG